MSKFAGIDYSMTSPAVCVYDSDTGETTFYGFAKKKCHISVNPKIQLSDYPSYSSSTERYMKLAAWTLQRVKDCDYVWIEGYAYASTGAVFDIGENTGILKSALFDCAIPFDSVQPPEVKKDATGKGNAKKGEMYTTFVEKTGLDIAKEIGDHVVDLEKIPSPVNDMIDAYFVLHSGLKRLRS